VLNRECSGLILLLLILSVAAPAQEFGSQEVLDASKAASVSRTFYDGPLHWYFYAGPSGVLDMAGYSTTANGGTISQVTSCYYNQSSFDRTFKASVAVEQSSTIQSLTFSRSFPPNTFTCHTLTGFNAALAPGPFDIRVTYDELQADNVFLGLAATDEGNVYDVSVGSQRPPHASGPQGDIPIHGVGIKYVVAENDAPPPPPPTCIADDTTLCLGNGRFKVQGNYTTTNAGSGMAHAVKLTDDTGYFWFFQQNNVEAVVKVLNGCGLNNHFWVFAGGLTDQGVTFTVTDTTKSPTVSRTYTNPRGTKWVTITDTSALSTCP
jgi:hypothetical protein